ncbi:MAG TPA: NADPH-dependent glutamate synthase [bacterium]|nr:NADPH-dependent glutamate synthase [bacterium]
MVPMPEQPPEVRRRNFKEVPLGYSREQAMAEASRCLQCKSRPCVSGCPVGIDIPGFVKAIADGDFRTAIRIVKHDNTLPAVCGRVCPQSGQCQSRCVLGKKGDPLAIGNLERFVADWERREGGMEMPELAPRTGKKVAVVGSGPAGLTVAADCARNGHAVTVFEALHSLGGVLRYGIPEFRMPKEILDAEVGMLEKMGVEFRTDAVIGPMLTVHDLLGQYDAVYLAIGAGLPFFMGIPGENLAGVYSANEYLTRSNLMKAYLFPQYDTPIIKGRRVAVIGGGNVAMDSARTALRLGAEEVFLIYRRSKKEMPARHQEIEHAYQEGIDFHLLRLPMRILGDEQGNVVGMEVVKSRLGEPDASGRRKPIPIPGTEYTIDVDVVVPALGNGANRLLTRPTRGLDTDKRGKIIADPETAETSIKGVYAGGDIVRGAATVILAMGDGRLAARAIHEYLSTS